MKKLLLTLTVVTVSALTMYGQGRIEWNNFSGGRVSVGVDNMGAAGGNAGDFLGADKYSVQLLFAPGTYANQAAFDAAIPTASPVVSFFPGSVTGLGASAGYYDGGVLPMGPGGTYTVQARAWYNVGFATYAAAVGNANTGVSQLGTIVATESPTLPNALNLPGFTVGQTVIPEPSTFALAGLGLAGLLIFRRRK